MSSRLPQEQGSWLNARIENAVGTTQLTVSGIHGQPNLSGSKRTWRSTVRNFHFHNQLDSLPTHSSDHPMPRSLAGMALTTSRMQRKLATCQGTNGRICFASQRSSLGIFRGRTNLAFYKPTSESHFGNCSIGTAVRDRPHKARAVRLSLNSVEFCWKYRISLEMDRQPAVRKFDLRDSVGAGPVGKAYSFLARD